MAYTMNGGKEAGSSYKKNTVGSALLQKGLISPMHNGDGDDDLPHGGKTKHIKKRIEKAKTKLAKLQKKKRKKEAIIDFGRKNITVVK